MKIVNLKKGVPGVSIIGGSEGIAGILATAIEITGQFEHGKVYTIYKPEDAEALGITQAYDIANNVRLYRHISEMYRMGTLGTKAYVSIAPQSVTMTDLIDKDGSYAKNLIAQSEGDISLLAVSINPTTGYTPVILDGMNADVITAIAKAQGFADWCIETNRPLGIILEGRDYTGPSASVLNLRALPNLNAENVAITIAQDWNYAEALDAVGQKFADVGTLLGAFQRIAVNANPGEVATMDLTDATLDVWMHAGLSSHQKNQYIESDLDTLNEKGFIFSYTDTNFAGFRFNDDPTCCEVIIDNDGNLNQHQFSYVRTWNKAFRLIRASLIPKIKSVQPLDKDGKLPVGVVKHFESLGNDALLLMIRAGELTDGKTFVDKDSDLISPPKVLNVSFDIQPYGTVGRIDGTINIKKSI